MGQWPLVLKTEGKRLVFPDGSPFCLVCGEASTASCRVWFEALDDPPLLPGPLAGKMLSLGSKVAAIAGRVTFDAPLCKNDWKQALLLSLKTTGNFLLGLILVILGFVLIDQLDLDIKTWSWGAIGIAAVPWLFAGMLWRKKDRGGLPCEAWTPEKGVLVLLYPEGEGPMSRMPAPAPEGNLDPEVRADIRTRVRMGYDDVDDIVESVVDDEYESGEPDPTDVAKAVEEEIDLLEREQESWPEETDCDRLTMAFDELHERGIIAIENAGYTMSDGHEDVAEAYAVHPGKESVIGFCFFHGQDLERAVNGQGINLAFGPMNPKNEEVEGPKIGRMVVEALEEQGFSVKWDGTYDTRILIEEFDWKKRR